MDVNMDVVCKSLLSEKRNVNVHLQDVMISMQAANILYKFVR